jgi:3-keto-L-gulonate-6-phosphate decarboxylase
MMTFVHSEDPISVAIRELKDTLKDTLVDLIAAVKPPRYRDEKKPAYVESLIESHYMSDFDKIEARNTEIERLKKIITDIATVAVANGNLTPYPERLARIRQLTMEVDE